MFRLQRYFTITSLIAFVLIAFLLGYFFRTLAISDLISASESKNVALTQTFANFLWPEIESFVSDANNLDVEELKNHPRTQELYELIEAQLDGLSVVKIKVYDMNGLTVFSTERAQIGENKLDNAGYLSAREGEVASELTFRDTFSAFEQTIEDRNVFSSYLPIYGPGGEIEGVFEVYDDVTPLVQQLEQTQRNIILGIVVILFGLYVVLFLIVRRADSIIKQQYAELIQNEKDLRVARDEALAASQFKSKLLANVSHEMRTPLHAIMGFAEILEQGIYGEISPQQHTAVRKILNSSGILLEFINNLLDRAQLESGKLNFNMKPFVPQELAEEAQSQVSVLAEAKGLLFDCDVEEEVPDLILGDRYWLRQLMLNLVSNAIKFTDEGSVGLHLFKDDGHWGFQVADTGPGIPEAAQARIFEAFEQVMSDHPGSKKGIGLGLSIVKEVTTLMDGDVTLESVEGEGTTFTITLPLLPVPAEVEAA
jgi:signal transduction histidine kinase